jgi:hypothetical protein
MMSSIREMQKIQFKPPLHLVLTVSKVLLPDGIVTRHRQVTVSGNQILVISSNMMDHTAMI